MMIINHNFQEHLSLKNNCLEKLYGELTELGCLRSLNMRHNNIKTSGIPSELFQLDELTTLDLSHNRLKEVPEGLERAKSLLVLNLSNNQ
jgi:Leucine-rich repeat (LRR) protein